jgi:hypothetical protein
MVTIADIYITHNECWSRAEQGNQQLQVFLLLRYVGARVVCSLVRVLGVRAFGSDRAISYLDFQHDYSTPRSSRIVGMCSNKRGSGDEFEVFHRTIVWTVKDFRPCSVF